MKKLLAFAVIAAIGLAASARPYYGYGPSRPGYYPGYRPGPFPGQNVGPGLRPTPPPGVIGPNGPCQDGEVSPSVANVYQVRFSVRTTSYRESKYVQQGGECEDAVTGKIAYRVQGTRSYEGRIYDCEFGTCNDEEWFDPATTPSTVQIFWDRRGYFETDQNGEADEEGNLACVRKYYLADSALTFDLMNRIDMNGRSVEMTGSFVVPETDERAEINYRVAGFGRWDNRSKLPTKVSGYFAGQDTAATHCCLPAGYWDVCTDLFIQAGDPDFSAATAAYGTWQMFFDVRMTRALITSGLGALRIPGQVWEEFTANGGTLPDPVPPVDGGDTTH